MPMSHQARVIHNSPSPSRSVVPNFHIHPTMEQPKLPQYLLSKHFSEFVFVTGSVSPNPCSRCEARQLLCIVSRFSTCCGLCLRSASHCSYLDQAVYPWAEKPDNSPTASTELYQDLARAVSVIQTISGLLNSSSVD